MLKIVLFEPEIPPNTGNIIRLCANTGCSIHLIEPLGFALDDKKLRRAGLDYAEFAELSCYPNLDAFCLEQGDPPLYAVTTKGETAYQEARFKPGDAIVFGPETRGLPISVLSQIAPMKRLRIPMKAHSRSLNLSNATAVVVYEALRQNDFDGLQ